MPNRFALIYLPGLEIRNRDQSIDIISRRIANGLNFLHSKSEYVIEESNDVVFGAEDQVSSMRTIRSKGKTAKEKWQLDVYSLNYYGFLESGSGPEKKRSQFRAIAMALWFSMTSVLGLLFKKGKTTMEKLRMLGGVVILIILAAYLFMIIPTFAGTLHQYLHDVLDLPESNWLSIALHWLETKTRALNALYVGSLTVGLFSNRKIQNQLRRYTLELAQVIRYFNSHGGEGRPAQQLLDLIKYVKLKKPGYQRIDLLAYSFGNVVVMDTMFTLDNKPGEWVTAVHNFVGIGNPYDVVRTFWPRYFLNRLSRPATPQRWINIYSPRDLLASNFRNDRKEIGPEKNVVPGADLDKTKKILEIENIVFPSADSLKGVAVWQIPFKVRVDTHRKYWSGKPHEGNKCITRVAELLYN